MQVQKATSFNFGAILLELLTLNEPNSNEKSNPDQDYCSNPILGNKEHILKKRLPILGVFQVFETSLVLFSFRCLYALMSIQFKNKTILVSCDFRCHR